MTRLKLSWPISSLKISKMLKKCFLGEKISWRQRVNKLLIEVCAKPEDIDCELFWYVICYIARFDQFALKKGEFCTKA